MPKKTTYYKDGAVMCCGCDQAKTACACEGAAEAEKPAQPIKEETWRDRPPLL